MAVSARARPVPGRWRAHPLPTFLPRSIHPRPPPPAMVPGEQALRRPSSQTTSCCPLPIQTLVTKHPPPTPPACGDSLLAPDLPYPPSVRNRCRQTVRTTRVSSDSVWTPPPPLASLALSPHPVSPLSPLCLSICIFPADEDIDKVRVGRGRGPASQGPPLACNLHTPQPQQATHLSSSLTFFLPAH